MKYELVKKRARLFGITQSEMAKALGIKQPTLSQKLSGARGMTVAEAEKLAELLGIGDEMFTLYFFSGRRSAQNEEQGRNTYG